ncbi:putative Zn(II)2Cys6 transcription factor-like protein [Massariosphaeria phaeospora]|uniref:Putative Zn(II)2Cys6 transcription factor-like protein n=1 Tax=Massariosphaeria phaeospora TaxID=100035 RepID=A0A7C8IBF7_9PLEO|nr:putative Zn(II)2Cys6 transcription factor-like protein [Massariosphaeria phaeospora]
MTVSYSDERIFGLVQRLSQLEASVLVNQKASPSTDPGRNDIAAQTSTSETIATSRPVKRKRSDRDFDEVDSVAASETDSTIYQADDARDHIRKELSHNGLLSGNQRMALEAAIALVDQISQAPSTSVEDPGTWSREQHVATDLSPGEILHIVLGTQNKHGGQITMQLHALDHIPQKAFERIAFRLIDSTDDEQTLNMYKVIVHWKAAVVLYGSQLESVQSETLQKRIRTMELRHLYAALTALDHVSFMNPPSLLLLQALISAAMLMQIAGDPNACWALTASASRTLVALGYHNLRHISPRNELDLEIQAAVAWCCQLDRCMSLLLLRPPSLPKLHIAVSQLVKLDPSNPMSGFAILELEFAPVHEKILELILDAPSKDRPEVRVSLTNEVAILRQHMAQIAVTMEMARAKFSVESNLDLLLHWQILDFKFFSTLTSVHRLSPTVTSNRIEREECLDCARKALERVKLIQENAIKQAHFVEEYNPYLSWSILSYPLGPFFVVFCNVVGTSNTKDFQLLQDVADGVGSISAKSKFIIRLHRLCVTLLDLCRPLVARSTEVPHTVSLQETPAQASSEVPPKPHDDGGIAAIHAMGSFEVADALATSSWDDDSMWQLFQSQPSLDWFNADIPNMLDPSLDYDINNFAARAPPDNVTMRP